MADEIDNSMAPDLDPAVETIPDGPLGDLMRQRDRAMMSRESARAMVIQYQRVADAGTEQIEFLDAQIAAMEQEGGS